MPQHTQILTSIAAIAIAIVLALVHDHLFDFLSAAASGDFTLVWPPTRRSAPVLVTTFVSVGCVIVVSFMQTRTSPAQKNLHQVKAKLIAAQLSEAIRWQEKKDSDADEEEEEKKTKKEDDKDERRPPEAKELFEMLYDEVEERHVTDFGISADDSDYVAVLAMFKQTVPDALAEATRCTRIARGSATAEERAHGDCEKRVALFKDGYRLRDLLDLYDGRGRGTVSIRKAFGKLAPEEFIQAARACRKEVEREQRQSGVSLLFALVRPLLPLYCLSGLLMAFDSAVGAANWHAIATLLDGIDSGAMTVEELGAVFLQSYAKFGLCIFAHLTSCFMTEKVAGRFATAVKSAVLRGVLRQDMLFFDIHASGVVQERLTHDANDLTSKCFHLPMRMLHHAMMILSNAIAVYHIRPELLMIAIAPLPVVAIVQRVFIKRMDSMHKRGRKIAERVVANTNEVIKEMRTVRSFAMEAEEAERYDAQSEYRTQITESCSIIHHCVFIAPLVLMFVGTRLLATYHGGAFVAMKLITVGMAVQVGNAADHLQHCIRDLLEALPEIFKVVGPVGRVCDAISSRPTIEPFPGCAAKLQPEKITGRIEFRDVNFTFPSEPQKQILHGLSFSAAPGEKVGLVGSTGCGKSTAISLIQRFYDPTSGSILLDGRSIAEYDVHYLRRHISVVAQDSVLFSTTIRENITYGLPKARRDLLTDAEIEDACRMANALEFISKFPRRLETFCGERGVKLSGGQKQRLAIARAIIRKPTICLLDEATSALDSKAEGVVQAALDCMIGQSATGCTLMIAHRLSTVKNCDRILCLDKGQVKEQGTHDELLAIDVEKDAAGRTVAGLYNDLWTTQMGTPTDAAAEKAASEKALAAAKRRVAELELECQGLTDKLAKAEEASTLVSLASSRLELSSEESPLSSAGETSGEEE